MRLKPFPNSSNPFSPCNGLSSISFLKKKSKALEALELALKQAYQSQNRLDEARIEICYGLMDGVSGSKEKEQHILKGLAIFSQFRIPEGMAHSYLALGQVQLRKGQIREAENTVYKSFELTKQLGNLFLTAQAVKMLGEIKEREGDLNGTIHFFKLQQEITGELRRNEAKQMIGAFEVQQKYEATQAEAEIFRLRNEALKRQSEDLLELYRTIRTINAFGQRITSNLELEELAQEIYQTLSSHLPCDTLGLATYSPETKSIEFEILLKGGKPMKTFSVSIDSTDSFSSWTVLHQQSLLLNNMPKDFGQYFSQEPTSRRFPNSRSAIFLPLLKGKAVKGIFTVQAKETDAYSRQHLNLLESLGSFITIAMENAQQHSLVQELNQKISEEKAELEYANEKIAHLANHDQLTGLANRRLLGEIMNQQIRHAKRGNDQFAVFFIDLDGFKAINDRYGHEKGDKVLVDCAGRIRSSLRESDFVARVGGDEFVVLTFGECDKTSLSEVAIKILRKVNQPLVIQEAQGKHQRKTEHISASIGIAIFPQDGKSLSPLLNKADKAMYRVKSAGKDNFLFIGDREAKTGTRPHFESKETREKI
jgi:diguanylate cyclase (GGDEF)-like protein